MPFCEGNSKRGSTMGTLGVGLYVLFRDVPASTASYAVFLESGMSQNITSLAG